MTLNSRETAPRQQIYLNEPLGGHLKVNMNERVGTKVKEGL